MKMVDREKIIKKLEDYSTDSICTKCAYYNVHCIGKLCADTLKLLKEQTEQKHGHWVFDPDGMDWNIPAWRCSVCTCRNDNIPPNLEKTNPLRWSGSKFCPNCGAKMDEEAKQDETR